MGTIIIRLHYGMVVERVKAKAPEIWVAKAELAKMIRVNLLQIDRAGSNKDKAISVSCFPTRILKTSEL